jgi:N-acetylneuraminic acid mutarotase
MSIWRVYITTALEVRILLLLHHDISFNFTLIFTATKMVLPVKSLCVAFVAAAASAALNCNDTAHHSWTTLSSIPELRQEHTTVAMNDETIAVVGGVTPIVGNNSLFTGVRTVDWVHLYDVASDTWRAAAPMPLKINHPNVVAKDGLIYLLGGLVDRSDPPTPLPEWVATGQSFVYDPQTDAWSMLNAMPPGTERGSAIMGVHDELIYLAGGMTVLDGYQDAVTTVTAFNTTSGKWQRVVENAADLPDGRQHGAGVIADDMFYVVGGRWYDKSNVRGEVFMLDLNNQTAGWITGLNRMPTARGGICGALVGRKFYTFGGEANPNAVTGIFDNVEAFDLDTLEWMEMDAMSVPRHGTSAAAIGNKIYIPGGGLQEDGLPVYVDGVMHIINTTSYSDVLSV